MSIYKEDGIVDREKFHRIGRKFQIGDIITPKKDKFSTKTWIVYGYTRSSKIGFLYKCKSKYTGITHYFKASEIKLLKKRPELKKHIKINGEKYRLVKSSESEYFLQGDEKKYAEKGYKTKIIPRGPEQWKVKYRKFIGKIGKLPESYDLYVGPKYKKGYWRRGKMPKWVSKTSRKT